MNEITIGDKLYISSKRAAEITGYAKDYVGQLCREGHVDAKMVGRGWYVYEPSIRAHRFGVEAESLEEEVTDDAAESVSNWEKPTYSSELPQELPELLHTVQPATQTPTYVEPSVPAEQTLTDMQAAWREWFERKQEVLETPELESPEVLESRYEAREEHDEREEELTDEVDDEDDELDVQMTESEEEITVPLHRIEEEATYVPEITPLPAYTTPEMPISVPIRTIPAPAPVWPTHDPVRPASFGLHDVIQPLPVAGIRPSEYASVAPERNEGRVIEERIMPKKAGVEPKLVNRKGSNVRRGKNSYLPVIALLIAMSVVSIAIAAIGSGMASKYFQTSLLDNPIFDFLVGDREFKR